MILNGYEAIDSNIIRWVSSDANYHTLRRYSSGANVDFKVPTEAKIQQIEVALAIGGLFSGP